ncbi:MAG: hypothetical protein O3A25_07070 [Acidobacteria bacterium]|nr:hypothetical protein [Acidobacteriota bacterium]
MMRDTTLLALTIVLAGGVVQASADTVNGYAEWRRGDALIVEGQVVRVDTGTRFEGDVLHHFIVSHRPETSKGSTQLEPFLVFTAFCCPTTSSEIP